jgi:prolyl 4-hydroxylase
MNRFLNDFIIANEFILIILFFSIVLLFSLFFPTFFSNSASKKREFMTDNTYQIQEIPNFLTNEECDLISQISHDKLFKSRVYSSTTDIESDVRDSEQCWLKNDAHELIHKISLRVSEITGTDVSDQEELQVVKYNPGGYYRPHYDACDSRKENCDRFNGDKGVRFITFIIYLNDDFEGGETYFPNIDQKVKPQKGKAAIFYNTGEDGIVLEKALHGGLDVVNGTKWICNKWIRRKINNQEESV